MTTQKSIAASIIVPVYHSEKYIRKCIESILAQTVTDFELLLVLDGNVDSSPRICKDYASRDARIRIFEQENQGVSAARNRGLDNAVGKYVLFVDSDDWIEEQYIKNLLQKAEESNSDIVISGYCMEEQTSSTRYDHYFCNGKDIKDGDKTELLISSILNMICVPWAKLYRRSFLEEHKLRFHPCLKRMEDCLFNLYAFWYANSTQFISDTYYHYFRNEKSLTKAYTPDYSDTAVLFLNELDRFVQKTEFQPVQELRREVSIILALEMVKQQFVPKNCNLSRRQKIRRIRDILENQSLPFCECIHESHTYYLDAKAKIVRILLRLRQYWLVYLYCEWKSRIHR